MKEHGEDHGTRSIQLNRRGLIAGAAAVAAAGRAAHAAPENEVKVGVMKPLTGGLVSSYAPLFLVVDLAIDEINRNGGILGRKLVKTEVDDEGSPARAPVAAQRLIEQGATFIMGPAAGSSAIAALEISTRAKVLQASYATADEVGDGKRYPYHYQFCFTSTGQVARHVEYLDRLGIKDMGILVEDGSSGIAARDAMIKEAANRGIKVASEQVFEDRTSDMTPFLRKLRGDGAKGIDVHIANNTDITQFFVGLSRIGWKPPIVGHTGLLLAGTPGAIPASARYNDVFAATYKALTYTDTEKPPARVQGFARKILSSDLPDTLLGYAATSPFYDALMAFKAAAEATKSLDADVIKKALDGGLAIDGLFGPVTFTDSKHTAYGSDVLAMAMVNSGDEAFSKEFRGLFRRRGPAVS